MEWNEERESITENHLNFTDHNLHTIPSIKGQIKKTQNETLHQRLLTMRTHYDQMLMRVQSSIGFLFLLAPTTTGTLLWKAFY